MLEDYAPILLHIIVAVGFASVTLMLNLLLGRRGRRTATKEAPYECGVIPEVGRQPRFSVKFYLVAMLFILFDIEVVFMVPWAVAFRETLASTQSELILGSMALFAGVLLIGYVYAIKKGALDWSR